MTTSFVAYLRESAIWRTTKRNLVEEFHKQDINLDTNFALSCKCIDYDEFSY